VFVAVVVLVTVAAFGAAVRWWPKLTGRTVRSLTARAGALLGVNLLVLLTAAVVLNDQYTFFADWTDLAGAMGRTQTFTTAHGGTSAEAAAAAPVSVAPRAPASQPALPVLPAGERILRYTVTGAISGISAPVMVELPAGYSAPAARSRQYPVLETFHGIPGDIAQWIDSMDLGGSVAATVAKHQLSDVLVVSPSIEIPRGRDTECVNGSAADPKVETWLTQDVPNWVLHTFRVRPGRAAWATIGLSAGGWCAAMAAMLHPDRYAASIVLGGYFRPEFSKQYQPFRQRSAQAQRYDLIALAHNHAPPVALWVETSHSDPISYPSASLLLQQAKPPLSVTSVVLAHAGHRMSLWQGLLPQALAWLGSNIPGFKP
jgi:enterochelin esterase-like enzyme